VRGDPVLRAVLPWAARRRPAALQQRVVRQQEEARRPEGQRLQVVRQPEGRRRQPGAVPLRGLERERSGGC
jgi:hypothetical protein